MTPSQHNGKPSSTTDTAADAAGKPGNTALAYGRRLGWHVLPLHNITDAGVCSCQKGENCGRSTAKHPRIRGWQKDASADPATIRDWWLKWPRANVGILTGPESGIFDLECEEEGIADLAAIQEANGPLPRTPQAQSGNGGLHHIFRWPAGGLIVTTGSHLDKRPIDTRGRGGQFVAPPSRNKGGEYRWVVSPFDVAPAEAPEWLLGWLETNGRLERPAAGNGKAQQPFQTRARAVRQRSVEELAILYLGECPAAISGQGGHAQTFRAARAVVYGFDLGVERGLSLLLEHYNPRCKPEWSEKELRHKANDADSKPFSKARGYLIGDSIGDSKANVDRGDSPPASGGDQQDVHLSDTGGARPSIEITTARKEINNQAIDALAAAAMTGRCDLFQRAGLLVRILRGGASNKRIRRPEGAARIALVGPATLGEEMAAAADWKKWNQKERKIIPAHPPDWSIKAVHERGEWPGIRPLAGVVESPTLRPDGTILDTPGYDDATALIYHPSAVYPPLPERPSRDDAGAAARRLLNLIDEFPLAACEHAAAWLAALLTVLARPAIGGPCPLFLFEAPTAGSGKTLLAELVGLIATGREVSVSELSDENEEMRKTLTSILLEGERLVLFDNASGSFGCRALDAVLTATTYKGRLLGQTKRTPEVPIETVFLASGNNVTLKGDTHRRVVPCRIVPLTDRPEERTGFRIPDLKGHVRQHRPGLVVDALTILKRTPWPDVPPPT